MNKAELFFSEFKNSFCVYIKNLEDLSVEQIQEIECFVKERRGVFDFNSYSFVIQKRLSFQEFVLLIESSGIKAICKENLAQTSDDRARIEFGQYKGLFYSDVPDSYLKWLKSNYKGKDKDALEQELKNRNL